MKEKRNLLTGTGLIGTFALWTVLIQCLDVQAVGQIYVETTIVVAIVYCIYLGRIKEDAIKNENGSIPDSGIHTDIGDKGGDK